MNIHVFFKEFMTVYFIVSIGFSYAQTNVSTIPELIPYRKGNKMGFCDKNKNIVINCIYQETYPFSEGLARVKQDDKWGFINEKGKVVIPCMFDFVFDFKEGFAVVKKESKYGFIDKKGKPLTPLKYEFAWSFNGGYAGVGFEDFKWGFINQKGKEVISHNKFYNIWDFMDDHEIVDINGFWGYYFIENGDIYLYGLNPWSFYGDFALVENESSQLVLINKNGEIIPKDKINNIFKEKGYVFIDKVLEFNWSNIKSFLEILNIKYSISDSSAVKFYFHMDDVLRRTLTPDGHPAYKNVVENIDYWE